jgi:exodeoxyribonuclease V gamma subunit
LSEREIAPGFMVIHGNQPELLRQLLVHWFRSHPLAPLEDEVVLVQSNGIAQWLKLALAASDNGSGIAAALDMSLPSRFVWQTYRAVLGNKAVPDASPFDKPMLLWRLMRLLPGIAGLAGYEPLARFLHDDGDCRKRYQLAERIADLFDQYQVYRADWLDAWARGQDTLFSAEGQSHALTEEFRWQPMLWRLLLEDVGEQAGTSRAAVHSRFLTAIDALAERPAGLARRVSVFGLSSLPRQSLEVLQKISRFSQVLLCTHNPCEHYWADILSGKDHARRAARRHNLKSGMPAQITPEALHLHANPLLAAWGRQGRDYIAVLDEIDQPEQYRSRFEHAGERIDLFESHGTGTLLNQLQEDIRELRAVRESQTHWNPVDPATDGSLRFHLAHSAQREVEILHDQLLDAFNADNTLRPRDIIVMVPDIDAYAPHIAAVFGQIDPADKRYIPFSIADQGQRHQAPLIFALDFLLRAPEARFSVSELFDLLDVAAVSARFGISPGELPLLHRWIEQTRIRWGLDAAHREPFMGHGYEQNSWHHGLKRMILGYAVGSDPAARAALDWQGIEPYGEVSGLDAALAGKLFRLIEQLEALVPTLATPASPAQWHERLQTLMRDFLSVSDSDESFLLLQLQSALRGWLASCEAGRLEDAIPLVVVREHWLAQIDQTALSRRFMDGRLTFATLMPMRAIPFRMVCLLGMNDGDYPRARPPLDFDLMAQAPRPGDRSRREDDRYLFLEALLSARERLHVSWVGRSVHDNTPRPPSVLVSQLRDHLATCWSLAPGTPHASLLDALTVEHRLQPFSPAYFGAGPSALFTYAREWERTDNSPAADDGPLPPPQIEAPVSLGQLASFLKDPARSFLRERLGVDYPAEDLTSADAEPFSLDGLENWSLQDELIRARLDALEQGTDESAAVARQLERIRRRGELAIGEAANLQAESLVAPLDPLFARYAALLAEWPAPLEDWPFAWQHRVAMQTLSVEGRITRCFAKSDGKTRCRIELSTSKLIQDRRYRKDKLLGAWVTHLACNLGDTPTTTVMVGKEANATFHPLTADAARAQLSILLEAWYEGLSQPQPFAPISGFAWLDEGGRPATGSTADADPRALAKARSAYEGSAQLAGERERSPWQQRIHRDFDQLWANGRFSTACEQLLAPLRDALGEAQDK